MEAAARIRSLLKTSSPKLHANCLLDNIPTHTTFEKIFGQEIGQFFGENKANTTVVCNVFDYQA